MMMMICSFDMNKSILFPSLFMAKKKLLQDSSAHQKSRKKTVKTHFFLEIQQKHQFFTYNRLYAIIAFSSKQIKTKRNKIENVLSQLNMSQKFNILQ